MVMPMVVLVTLLVVVVMMVMVGMGDQTALVAAYSFQKRRWWRHRALAVDNA